MSAEIERSTMRMSTADREQVIEHLQSCASDGRLTLDEFSARVDAVYAAKTFGELTPLLSDLPEVGGSSSTGIAVAAEEKMAPFGASWNRKGRWLVPRKILLRPKGSTVKLDFSHAVIGHREVEIEVDAKASNIRIVLPRDGWAADNLGLMASSLRNTAHNVGDSSGVGFQIRGKITASSLSIRRVKRFLWWEY